MTKRVICQMRCVTFSADITKLGLCWILKSHPPSLHQHYGLQVSTGITLRLAVGVALVPIGALITLTGDRTQRKMKKTITQSSQRKKNACQICVIVLFLVVIILAVRIFSDYTISPLQDFYSL